MMKIDYSQTYIYKLHAVTSVLDKVFDATLKRYSEVTFSQFNVMMSVQQFESGANQKAVSKFLEVSPAAVSRQIEMCKLKGWLTTTEVKGNRREQHVALTKSGKEVLYQALESLESNLFQIFCENSQSLDLSGHLDHLTRNTKGVLHQYSKKAKDSNKNGDVMSVQIPKARALFRGDINDAVIKVQKATGVNITPSWWNANVGNDGTTESILDRFDQSYAKLVEQQSK